MATGRVNVGSGGDGLNIFTQMSEPASKEGIWVKTSEKFKKVMVDSSVHGGGEWNKIADDSYTKNPRDLTGGKSVYKDGKIYVIGGSVGTSGASHLSEIRSYDILTDTWTSLAPSPISFFQQAVFLHGDLIYVHGGVYNNSLSSATYKYSITDNTWTLATSGYAKAGHSAILVGDDCYLIGSTTNVIKYNILNNTFTDTGIVVNRYGHSSTLIGNKIYIYGGAINNTNTPTNILQVIDLETMTLSNLTSSTNKIALHGAVAVENQLYILGGSKTHTGQITGAMPTDSFMVYDLLSDTWDEETFKMPYSLMLMCVELVDGRIFVMNGTKDGYTLSGETRVFYIETKVYPEKTIVLIRSSENSGVYITELVSPTLRILGDKNRLCTAFDDVFFVDTDILNVDSYYGDGTQWIKFKEASQ